MNKFLGNEHFIFTPENPTVPPVYGSNPSVEEATQFLNQQGEDAEIVEGHYGKPERSILVRHPKNLAGLHQMASDFGQESAIHSKGGKHEMHFYNGDNAGQIINGEGTQYFEHQPEDNFTKIHTPEGPVYFQHNFNFGKSEVQKSGYGPKGMGLYDPTVNARRKMGTTGQEVPIGPNQMVRATKPSAKESAAAQASADQAKSRQNPVKIYTHAEIVKLMQSRMAKSEPLAKIKYGSDYRSTQPTVPDQPMKIRLDEGANKGRVVNVVGDTRDYDDKPAFRVAVPTGEKNLKLKTVGGGIETADNSQARWNKKRKHKVVQKFKRGTPGTPSVSSERVAEAKDTHKFLTHSPEQKKLIHGTSLTRVKSSGKGWTEDWAVSGYSKNAKGEKVYVKGHMPEEVIDDEGMGDEYKELTTAQREGLYHNLAHMMGMGQYVPTTSVVDDDNDHYSVMKVIPKAHHYEGSGADNAILSKLRDNGEIDKLTLMNTLMGNTDRHSGNYMMSPAGIHMIDHGLTFDWHGSSGRDITRGSYYSAAHRAEDDDVDLDDIMVHPDAVKWFQGLDPKQFASYFKTHAKVPDHIEKPFLAALQSAQKMVKSNKGKVSMSELRDHILQALGDEVPHRSDNDSTGSGGS